MHPIQPHAQRVRLPVWRSVWGTREGAPVPKSGPPTRTDCLLFLAEWAAGSITCHFGAIMADIRPQDVSAEINQQNLKTILHYDPETGAFTWASRHSNKAAGSIAGHADHLGYWKIKIAKRSYRAHRLAWLYVYGEWPSFQIDHIDGDKANNAICNLRNGSGGVNQQNVRRPQVNNRSGFLGVHKRSDSNTYRVSISVDGVLRHFGGFRTAEEASDAYLQLKRQLHAGCAI